MKANNLPLVDTFLDFVGIILQKNTIPLAILIALFFHSHTEVCCFAGAKQHTLFILSWKKKVYNIMATLHR